MRVNAAAVLVLVSVLAGLGLTAQSPKPPDKPAAPAPDASTQQPPAAKDQPAKPKWPVSFIDTAMPAIRVSTPEDLALTLFLGNASAEAQPVAMAVALRTSSGAVVQTAVSCDGQTLKRDEECVTTLPAKRPVTPVTIKVALPGTPRDAYPLNGVVIMRPAGDALWQEPQPRATLPLGAIGLDSAPAQDWSVVGGSAMYALIAVTLGAVCCLALWGRWLPFTRMRSATFSFSESWSGALMVGGPPLAALLTFSAFPEHAHTMSKRSYLLLSLLLSALIALAPAIFNLLKLPTRVTNPDGTETTQNQGLVVFFFLAAVVSLTGGFGQLRLLGFALLDLTEAAFVSRPLGEALVGASSVLFWLVFLASIVSLVMTVAAATARPVATDDAGTLQKAANTLQDAVNAKPAEAKAAPLPSWSMP